MSVDETARRAQALLEAGHARYEAQDWRAAAELLAQGLALDPHDALGWYRLGNAREELGDDGEALACFEKALAADPRHAPARNNLGAALQRLGREREAEQAFRAASALDPALREPLLNLGRLLAARGDQAQAAECYRAILARHPDDPQATHLLAAATGDSPARAPEGYVRSLFDAQAPRFDDHLVGDLDYRIPQRLAGLITPLLGSGEARILDLGCGTGLVGAALAAPGRRLEGVDLSARMLERAAQRSVYASLAQEDLLEHLARRTAHALEAAVAADVFIYLDELRPIFAGLSRVLVPGGLFAFSVEATEGADYRLLPSGRYAHSEAGLLELARATGFALHAAVDAPIRREGSGYAKGRIVILRTVITRSPPNS